MTNGIVANGRWNLQAGRSKLSMTDLEKKYAKELANAAPEQKQKIHVRMAEDFLRQKNHQPSAGTLW